MCWTDLVLLAKDKCFSTPIYSTRLSELGIAMLHQTPDFLALMCCQTEELWETDGDKGSMSLMDSLFCSGFLCLCLFCLPSHSFKQTLLCSSEKNEQGTERRPHSDIFICVVLTQPNSPSERLMRRNGLVNEPTGCSRGCHHHLNAGVLTVQLWPPTWMGNDLSAHPWHVLYLQPTCIVRPQQQQLGQRSQQLSRSLLKEMTDCLESSSFISVCTPVRLWQQSYTSSNLETALLP